MELTGRIAIITGGNGGIGFGMAKALSRAGATVVIAGRNAEKNDKAVQDLGGKAVAHSVDVRSEQSCKALFDFVIDRFGTVNILINNAGINIRAQPATYSLKDWHEMIDTNVTSALICSQLAYPHMVKAGGGKIINTGSMMTWFALPLVPAYAASKAALVQLGNALAVAWGKDNIQVNAVLPGFIDTDLTRMARQQIQGMNERVLARTPAGRWGNPDDLGGIAVFLSSSASDFVSGAVIPVDGGFSVQG